MQKLGQRFRTAFLTGASAGLGRAFTRMLLDDGVRVWGTARAAERLEAVANHPGFRPVVLDLTDGAGTVAAYETARRDAGGFDLVVNNAGYGVFGCFADVAFATWEAQMAAMLVQPMNLAREALRDFRERGCGTLVNVTSLAVDFPLPYMSGYNVVKAGLAAFSESLLIETAGTGVTVLDFRPGDYRTGFNRAMSHVSSTLPAVDAGSHRLRAVWRKLEDNLEAGPDPSRAAADLRHALERGTRGTVCSGTWFQARFAPLTARLLPGRLRRALHWRYFNVR